MFFEQVNNQKRYVGIVYLRSMIKGILFSCFLLCFQLMIAQSMPKIKRKWQGTYDGNIPAYQLNTGNELLEVESNTIKVIIEKEKFIISLGVFEYVGEYISTKQQRKMLYIVGKIEGRTVNEYFFIDRKKKQLTRSGIIPQPDLTLDKLRKKQGK